MTDRYIGVGILVTCLGYLVAVAVYRELDVRLRAWRLRRRKRMRGGMFYERRARP